MPKVILDEFLHVTENRVNSNNKNSIFADNLPIDKDSFCSVLLFCDIINRLYMIN